MLAPTALPGATLEDVQQLLSALLMSPSTAASASAPAEKLLVPLAQQTHAALLDLADDERPTSYEGLLDVARFCVEEEPAWAEAEQKELCAACAEDSIDSLWDAATARTASVTADAAKGPSPASAAPQAEPSAAAASEGSASGEPADEAFDQPFIALSVFTKLVQASPVLSHFFEQDLSGSFQLRAPAPQQESAREALATLAAVAVTGGGGGQSTARRVRGLLGGLLGEVGDRVGKVTGRETRTGPLPSFGQQAPASLAESSSSQAALGAKTTAAAASSASSSLGRSVQDAEEDVRAATARLVEQAASSDGAFVIDEAVGEDDEDDGDEDDEAGELSLAALGGEEEQAGAGGREQRIAKDLRTAAAAQ